MPIRLLCANPDCTQELEFEDGKAGNHATCLNCGAEIRVPAAGEMVGRQLGNYHILELLGRGSAAKVYRARPVTGSNQLAIKILDPALARDTTLIKRFEREARVTVRMNHSNVVRGFGMYRDSFHVYLIMELVIGENVKDRLERKGKLELRETMKIALAMARALAHGQEHGLVHRDVKPANIIIDETGAIKLTDFGMAHDENDSIMLTTVGVNMGTPLYTAPEQARDARMVDHRSDIYALGVTLLHLLTGQHPFRAHNPAKVIRSHEDEELPSGNALGTPLPEPVDALIARMSAKDPADRFQDYTTLESEIAAILHG